MEVAHDIPHVHGEVEGGIEHAPAGWRAHVRAGIQDDLAQTGTIVAELGYPSKLFTGENSKPKESA